MSITYITPDAELDDLIARAEAGTAQIEGILNKDMNAQLAKKIDQALAGMDAIELTSVGIVNPHSLPSYTFNRWKWFTAGAIAGAGLVLIILRLG